MEYKMNTYDSTYVFSAERQEEVKRIYQKYVPPEKSKKGPSEEEQKIDRLRRLDKSVAKHGSLAALFTGFFGAIIHAVGIALIQRGDLFLEGALIAIAGLILVLAAYPAYCYAAKKRRDKVEAEIVSLCMELMK